MTTKRLTVDMSKEHIDAIRHGLALMDAEGEANPGSWDDTFDLFREAVERLMAAYTGHPGQV